MSNQILYLFPDTNLFIQCKQLEELDWGIFGEYEEIHLIVSRPVQKEIDYQKNKGNGRVGKRARSTNTMFGKVLSEDCGFLQIKDSSPIVKVFLSAEYKPTKNLSEELDYREKDDQLVGTVYEFNDSNMSTAWLLTSDTGPRVTAKYVKVPCHEIPENWLLKPENNDVDKEKTKLLEEISKLRKNEPDFHIKGIDSNGLDVGAIEIKHFRYSALTEKNIAEMMRQIKDRYPLTLSKGMDQLSSLASFGRRHVPPTDVEINEYQEKTYPKWLLECEDILKNLHLALQLKALDEMPLINIRNDGAMPAKNTKITFIVKGDFILAQPLSNKEKEDHEDMITRGVSFSIKPAPPSGRTVNIFSVDYDRHFGLDPHHYIPALDHQNIYGPKDPNKIYYVDEDENNDIFSYECDNWRHGKGSDIFNWRVLCNLKEGNIVKGAINCQILADNLPNMISKTIPLTIKIEDKDTLIIATEILDSFCVKPKVILTKKGLKINEE